MGTHLGLVLTLTTHHVGVVTEMQLGFQAVSACFLSFSRVKYVCSSWVESWLTAMLSVPLVLKLTKGIYPTSVRPQAWATQYVVWITPTPTPPHCPPREGLCIIPLLLCVFFQRHRTNLILFPSYPICVYIYYSLNYIREFLPVSGLFSARISLHVGISLMCV